MYSFDAQNRFCVRERLKEKRKKLFLVSDPLKQKKFFYREIGMCTLCSQTNDYWLFVFLFNLYI